MVTIFLYILVILIGLAIGSFLNVVIIRYPIMLTRAWRAECLEFLGLPSEPSSSAFNLAIPRSQCPHCHQHLKFWHNIPLLSYILLRGRCYFCKQPLSIQYPLIELLTTITTLVIFVHFGLNEKTFCAWLLTWGLIILGVIDWQHQILPDNVTLPLLWIGLLVNTHALFAPLNEAVLAAMMGYLLLWIVAYLFKKVRKKQGMGHGDFKMLAMFGAWTGLLSTLNILLIAVILSLVVSLILLIFKKIHRDQPLPFGPALAIAGWCVLVFL